MPAISLPASTGFDATFWLTAGVILVLLAISAFFSSSETALTAASRAKLHALADRGEHGARSALVATEDGERLIGTILLGNNVVNILAASLATAMFTRAFGGHGVALATLVMTVLVLIFAEVLPKTYAIQSPEALACRVSRPIRLIVKVLSPLIAVVRVIVRGILRLMGQPIGVHANMLSVQDEIAGALAIGHSAGAVEKEDRDRLLGALDLGDRTVDEVMLHRSEIEMIDADLPASEILDTVLSSSHTRLPVYRSERENVIGIIHAKDLLRAVNKALGKGEDGMKEFDPISVAMKPYFVPETTALDEQMREFMRRRAHFALVIDEYGSLRGLITLEDILEEIVGEIADEHDVDESTLVTPSTGGAFIVEGVMTIRDLNRALDWDLPDDEANTVAGLLIHMAQQIPQQGQVFSFHGYRFEVLARRENRITRLRIRPLTTGAG